MKFSNLALIGMLAGAGCDAEPVKEKPTPAPVVEATSAKEQKLAQAGYPEFQLTGQTVEFKKPEGLTNMSEEEFENLIKGLSAQFAQGYKEYAARPLEDRKQKRIMNETILSFCRFLSKKSHNKIDAYFEATFPRGSKTDLPEVVTFLNQFLHADGSHLRLRVEDGVWMVDQYRFENTDSIEVHDKLGGGTYPILHITENLTGELPSQTLAEGDVTGMLIQFYVKDQKTTAERLAKEVSSLPTMTPPKDLEDQLTKDTLGHEGAHMLLIERERELNLYKGCVQARVDAEIHGYGTLNLDGCFTARQIQELCGYSAELAASQGAGKWTLLDRLDDDVPSYAPDHLFVRLIQPYSIDRLALDHQGELMQQLGQTGTISTQDVKTYAAMDLTAPDVQAIGKRGFDECRNLTEQLQGKMKREGK